MRAAGKREKMIRKKQVESEKCHPIGVFDSGVGGLTVVRALMERMPFENIIYFGDTARVPYGVKSVETITRYAMEITAILLKQQVKLLIIACNTMASVAYDAVAGMSSVPVLEVIDAGAKHAASVTHNGSIGVIGTPATINSNAYARMIHRCDSSLRVFSQACALLVPLVEEGWLDHPVTHLTVQEYLKPVLAEHIDTLVLGCTHYPLLKALLQEVAGPDIYLVDSAEAMAQMTAELLADNDLANPLQTLPPPTVFVCPMFPTGFRQ